MNIAVITNRNNSGELWKEYNENEYNLVDWTKNI